MSMELRRQAVHLLVGLTSLIFLLCGGRDFAIAIMFVATIVSSIPTHLRLLGMKPAFVGWLEQFERKGAPFLGWGSAAFFAGLLLLLAFLTDVNQIAASIFIVTVGDGFSTIVGHRGNIRLPYNKKKTLEGSLAFLLSSLPAYYFIGTMALPLVFLATLVESIHLGIDDNITIPASCIMFFMVI